MRRPPAIAFSPGRLLLAALTLNALVPLRAAPAEPPSAAAPFAAEVVKAAYLVNFIRFTEWPGETPVPGSPYTIGIAGNRALEDELIRLSDRQLIRGRRIRVVRLKSAHDLDGLHVAYFDQGAAAQAETLPAHEALPLLQRRPVLTVSDAGDFTERGGIVRLYREDGALRFEIAPDAAREAGLVLSSRLLALARIHRGEPTAPPPPK